MSTNIEIISNLIDYIDDNLYEDLSLDKIAEKSGYSKFHLHRMFSFVVGFPIHAYVKRRQLTEAARQLVKTKKPIIDIAIDCGYTSQQAFTSSFKTLYKKSPDKYRKKNKFIPMQLKFEYVEDAAKLGKTVDICERELGETIIMGYKANTKNGFWVIPICHKKLEKVKTDIENRTEPDYILGLDDYSLFSQNENMISFDYYAAVEVSSAKSIPKGMSVKVLPATNYLVFTFWGNKKTSFEHISTYIYSKWFPQTNYIYNESAMYDFVKSSEFQNEKGQDKIEYWVPIL